MPRLPNLDQLDIPDAKLSAYLLALSHPEGGPKARFLARFGFTFASPDILRQALFAHATANDIEAQRNTAFGAVFEVRGPLPSPDGRNPVVVVVWMIEHGASYPRLLTLVP